MRALAGLRVVDFSHHIAGPTVAMVLGDLGADVVRVDPPGGPVWDHDANAMLQRGKRSIVLDLHSVADREVATGLIERADIVIESFRPRRMREWGLGPEDALSMNSRVIYVSMPGFARDDPRAEWPAWEGVVEAAAGLHLYPGTSPMNYVGDRTRDPFYSAIPKVSSYASFIALHSIGAALIARERSGAGQQIEVALYDAAFELIGGSMQKLPTPPPPPPTTPPFGGGAQLGHYRCSDGNWIHLCLFQDKHLRWFAEKFYPQDWLDDGMGDAELMHTDVELNKRARGRFRELFATRTAGEWERAINDDAGAAGVICQSTERWLRDDSHARDVSAVVELVDHEFGLTQQAGAPVLLSQTPAQFDAPRRVIDADRESILADLKSPARPATPASSEAPARPLAGVRVIDVSQVLAGPTTARVLAEYGAEVVKVNSFEDRQLGMHLYTNSGKRSILLNLKTEEGMQILEELAQDVDVFVQNFTRGVADRMGIGEQALRMLSPDVIYASVSAFGHQGFRGGWRGREELGQAVAGMQVRYGGFGQEPLMAPMAICDFGSGNLAAFGVLIGLYHRLRGGSGQAVHASLAHTATFMQLPFMVAHDGRVWDEPSGLDSKGWSATDRLYLTSDRWIYLGAPRPEDRALLEQVDGLVGADLADADDLAARFLTAPASTWVQRLTAAGLGAHQLMDLEEVMEDELNKQRGLSIVREHPGIGAVRLVGPPPRLSHTPARAATPAGPPGADTRPILAELDREERLEELIQASVVMDGLPEGTTFVGRFR